MQKTDFAHTWGNLLALGTLHFAPENEHTSALIDWFNSTTEQFKNVQVRTHSSPGAAVKYILQHLDERTWALINLNQGVLQSLSSLDDKRSV
jgi:hypothetical protein